MTKTQYINMMLSNKASAPITSISKFKRESPEEYEQFKRDLEITQRYVEREKDHGKVILLTPQNYSEYEEMALSLERLNMPD